MYMKDCRKAFRFLKYKIFVPKTHYNGAIGQKQFILNFTVIGEVMLTLGEVMLTRSLLRFSIPQEKKKNFRWSSENLQILNLVPTYLALQSK